MLTAVYNTNSEKRTIEEKPNLFKVKCVNGSVKQRKKCSGYCDYYMHRGYLTEELENEHQCHDKNCYYYYTLNEINYKGKFSIKKQINSWKKEKEDYINNLLFIIQKSIRKFDGIKITKITDITNEYITLECITIFNPNLKPIKAKIEKVTGKTINLVTIPHTLEESAEAIYGIKIW